jgi:hypothetical protein
MRAQEILVHAIGRDDMVGDTTVRSIAEQIQLVIIHDRFGTVGRL